MTILLLRGRGCTEVVVLWVSHKQDYRVVINSEYHYSEVLGSLLFREEQEVV